MSTLFPPIFIDEAQVRCSRSCSGVALLIATAESCTGGLLAGLLTEIPGSSDMVERGFVTYSNAAKTELLGVPADLIARHGAVSEEVARAMAEGALRNTPADVAVSVTGIAGPGRRLAGKAGGARLSRRRRQGRRDAARANAASATSAAATCAWPACARRCSWRASA